MQFLKLNDYFTCFSDGFQPAEESNRQTKR